MSDKLKEAKPLPILTDDQKTYIEKNWEMDIRELTRNAFNDQMIDGRRIECKAVKSHLASVGKVIAPVYAVNVIVLTDEQKEYIVSYHTESTPLEMTRVLFKNPQLNTYSSEYSAVVAHCRHIDPNFRKHDEIVEEPYSAPTSMETLVSRVNKNAINVRRDGKPIYILSNLSNQDRKQLQALLSYMGIMLFTVEANKYRRKVDRDLFESTFILNTWDKADLLPEEVQQYISFAAETVRHMQIDRQAQQLEERHALILDDPSAKPNMTEIEWLNAMRQKLNESLKQSSALLKTLVGDRSKRIGERVQANATMHSLVDAWKREEDRRKIIQMNERKQKADLKGEIERLSDMESLKAEIFGLSREDILR